MLVFKRTFNGKVFKHTFEDANKNAKNQKISQEKALKTSKYNK